MDIYVLKNVVVRMEPAQLWMDHVTALWVSLEHTVTSHVYMDLLDSIAPSTAIAQLMEPATSSLESVSKYGCDLSVVTVRILLAGVSRWWLV